MRKCTYVYVFLRTFCNRFFFCLCALGTPWANDSVAFPEKVRQCCNARSFKNTVFPAGEVGFDSPARLFLTVAPSLPCSLCILLL